MKKDGVTTTIENISLLLWKVSINLKDSVNKSVKIIYYWQWLYFINITEKHTPSYNDDMFYLFWLQLSLLKPLCESTNRWAVDQPFLSHQSLCSIYGVGKVLLLVPVFVWVQLSSHDLSIHEKQTVIPDN